MRLFLDLETYSSTPISAGTHRYAEQAEILLLAYAVDDSPAVVCEHPAPAEMQALVDQAEEIVIHNSAFDRTVLRHQGVALPVDRVTDTMVLALMHSLPGSLDTLCQILRVDQDKAKAKDGKKLIRLFCQPQPARNKLSRASSATHPDEWRQFCEYARLDVEAMREIYRRLPRWNYTEEERQLWILDQRINDRGVAIDLDLVQSARRAVAETQASLAEQLQRLTDGALMSANQRDAVLTYIYDTYDVRLDDLQGSTVDQLIADPDTPEGLRTLLRLRSAAATTSVAKYDALHRSTSSDGRLRGTLQFCGAARTGRWAGRLFQPQNLPRPSLRQPEIDGAIAAIKAEVEDLLVPDVMQAASGALRGCIIAPPGRKLVVADLSNIEGRVLAWLARETWKIEAFEAYDRGAGPDLYKLAYAKSFGKRPEDVTKDERQIGKVQELACGYQGGLGAFSTMSSAYGLSFEDDRVKEIVRAWRQAHTQTVSLWYEAEEMAILATGAPGRTYYTNAGRIGFRRDKGWLRMILPSGRSLCYPSPKVEDGKLSYMGIDQYTRKWDRLPTYGGKLIENATQAAARDVLARGMLAADAAGYEIVLSVHDEIIAETPDTDEYTVDQLAAIMATPPTWADGLPLAAAGFEAARYRKD